MGLYNEMITRRSIRNFSDKIVTDEIIQKMTEVANNAPSGGNIQPLSIIFVDNKEKRNKLSEIVGNQPWVSNAPLSIIFCIDFNRVKRWAEICNTEFKGEQSFSHFLIAYADIICAAQNITILAEDIGLGSVYIGSIIESIDEARKLFKIPEYVLPLMVLTIGYPKSHPNTIPKLKSKIIAHRNEYQEMTNDEIKNAFDDKYGPFSSNAEEYLKKAYIEVIEAEKQVDEELVSMIEEKMKKMDITNNAQFLFNLRYPTEIMIKLNTKIYDAFRKAGFSFLDKK